MFRFNKFDINSIFFIRDKPKLIYLVKMKYEKIMYLDNLLIILKFFK